MGPSWGTGDVGEAGAVGTVEAAGADDGLDWCGGEEEEGEAVSLALWAWICGPAGATEGASVTLVERQSESAILVDRLKESLMAEMRERDSLILAVLVKWMASCDILFDRATDKSSGGCRGSAKLVALVMGRGECEVIVDVEEEGR